MKKLRSLTLGLAIFAATSAASMVLTPTAHAALLNFSFENDVVPNSGTLTTVPTNWTAYNQAAGGDIGVEHPGPGNPLFTPNNPLAAPADGNQFLYVNIFNGNLTGGVYQDTGILLANTAYTLTVAIGSRADRINSPGIISLYNGTDTTGTLLASGGGLPATQNTFQDYSVTFTTGATVTGDLTVGLSVVGAGTIQADFDNVRLTTAAVPEPSTVALCLLGGLGVAGRAYRRSRR